MPLLAHREGLLEEFIDVEGASWPATVPLPSGTRSIELQNECPFRAYAELRLGGEPMDLAQPGIAADIRGILLHRALEALWDRLQGSTALIALSEEDCECIDHGMRGQGSRFAVGCSLQRLPRKRASSVARGA